MPATQLDVQAEAAFKRAAAEYVQSENYNADRASARVNLGSFYANQGNVQKAEEELRAAIRLQPAYVPAYVNLADVYRAIGSDAQGEQILRDGLKIAPDNAMLHYNLGLALVRMQQNATALGESKRATTLDSGSARFAYVYAVALYSAGKSDVAIAKLDEALRAHPDDRDILEALVSIHQARGEQALAKKYAERLRTLSQEDN